MNATAEDIAKRLEHSGFAFEPALGCPWLQSVETAFGMRLPEPYRRLVERFRFTEFHVPGFEAFSNLGQRSGYDITDAPFKDPVLRAWLIPRGYLQIGRPEFANYDPVCFDMKGNAASPQIVRFDHEDILLERARVEPRTVAESFSVLVMGSDRAARDASRCGNHSSDFG